MNGMETIEGGWNWLIHTLKDLTVMLQYLLHSLSFIRQGNRCVDRPKTSWRKTTVISDAEEIDK